MDGPSTLPTRSPRLLNIVPSTTCLLSRGAPQQRLRLRVAIARQIAAYFFAFGRSTRSSRNSDGPFFRAPKVGRCSGFSFEYAPTTAPRFKPAILPQSNRPPELERPFAGPHPRGSEIRGLSWCRPIGASAGLATPWCGYVVYTTDEGSGP
jgi:hypothetical protein